MRRDLNRDPNRIIHSLKEEEPDIGSRSELYHSNDSEFDRRSVCDPVSVYMRIKFFLAIALSSRYCLRNATDERGRCQVSFTGN